jgi:hypothetical protein
MTLGNEKSDYLHFRIVSCLVDCAAFMRRTSSFTEHGVRAPHRLQIHRVNLYLRYSVTSCDWSEFPKVMSSPAKYSRLDKPEKLTGQWRTPSSNRMKVCVKIKFSDRRPKKASLCTDFVGPFGFLNGTL